MKPVDSSASMKHQPSTRDHTPWHALSAREALAALGSDEGGLSHAEARLRQARHGPNRLPRARAPGLAAIFLAQFKSPLIYLLLAAALVSVALGEARDALFIAVVLLANALVGASQEWQAARGAAALEAYVPRRAIARRDGAPVMIDAVDLVPGDVVELETGATVPADLRLIDARSLRADESLLTGESMPVDKSPSAETPAEAVLAERGGMLHAGTSILAGRAVAVVVRIGRDSEIGRIAGALALVPSPPPPLLVRLQRFTRALGMVTLASIAVLAVLLAVQGEAPERVFLLAVALAVSAIPEGLPVAISVALAVAARRMARVHVIVRRLPAVEGLGACTMIATDKTGTLTLNALTAARLWLPVGGTVEVTGEGYGAAGHVAAEGAVLVAASTLARAGALCNEATWSPRRPDARLGDTVDIAFLVLAHKLGIDAAALRQDAVIVATIPFEPRHRYAAHFIAEGDAIVAHVKGAAEAVLSMCLDGAEAAEAAEAMARDGYRVLAVASGPVGAPAPDALGGLTLRGLVGLVDPVRAEVPAAIARCRRAGVGVAMITGDHPETALAVARRLGLAERREQVVTGSQLAHASGEPDRFAAMVAGARIFARVEPTQKLAIVQAMQRAGAIVAVTGDGANDAAALQAANIGVAMGRSGTDAAREAADLILTDDNFASIVAGIAEGRAAYDNVRKVVLMLLATGAAEVMIFFLAQLLGLPLPLSAVQLLWLNLVTNGVQDVALAFERAEPGALDRPPRPPGEGLFDRRMIEQTLIAGGWMALVATLSFAVLLNAGMDEHQARNILLLLMVSFENAHTLNCRSETRSVFALPIAANPFVVLGVAVAQGLHVSAMHLPAISTILSLEPVGLATWTGIVALAALLIVVMEAYKRVRFFAGLDSGAAR